MCHGWESILPPFFPFKLTVSPAASEDSQKAFILYYFQVVGKMSLTAVCHFLRLSICESVPCFPGSDRRCYEGRACAGECGCSCQSELSVYLGSGRHWSDFKSLGKCLDLHKSFCVERHEWSRSWPDLFFLAKTLPSKHKGGSWGLSVLPREHRV